MIPDLSAALLRFPVPAIYSILLMLSISISRVSDGNVSDNPCLLAARRPSWRRVRPSISPRAGDCRARQQYSDRAWRWPRRHAACLWRRRFPDLASSALCRPRAAADDLGLPACGGGTGRTVAVQPAFWPGRPACSHGRPGVRRRPFRHRRSLNLLFDAGLSGDLHEHIWATAAAWSARSTACR